VTAAQFFASLRRRTTSGRFIPQIDGLRFIAITLVVLLHLQNGLAVTPQSPLRGQLATSVITPWIAQMNVGVPLFFMISGFILAVPFATRALRDGPAVSLRAYYWRRVTRLEPPYIISLLLFFVLRGWHDGGRFRPLLPHLAAGLLYLHGILFDAGNPINWVTWSLEVEVQFYLLFPLIAMVYLVPDKRLRRGSLAVGALAFALAVQAGLLTDPVFLPMWLPYFFLGMLIADIFVSDWAGEPRVSRIADGVGILAWVAFALILPYKHFHPLVLPLLFATGMFTALSGARLRRVFAYPVITTIGGMCYSIYLLHYWLLEAGAHALGPLVRGLPSYDLAYGVSLVILAPVVLLVCGTYFALIERPCMDRHWPERLAAAVRDRLTVRRATGNLP
jgi:peptidoglycan/LPS O-acetylase OafA/YrhL